MLALSMNQEGIGWLSGILLILGAYFAWNSWIKPMIYPDWTATFYYSPGDLSQYKQQSNLKNVDECRIWVQQQSYSLNSTSYDYECGQNCKLGSSGGPAICDETIK